MTIHAGHPFPTEPEPARQLRGRLGGAVSLWTAGGPGDRAGLTVTSLLLAPGPEDAVVALLDPDADLTDTLLETGRGVVQLLAWGDRQLAEGFAGTAPAPGGPFRAAEFLDTPAGPRLASATTWAELAVVDQREVGWSLLVTCRLERIVVGDDLDPLGHRRGRWVRIAPPDAGR